MLVIRRRAGQSLLIGEEIEIEILEIGLNKVKLGISGSRSVQVVRKEVVLAAESNKHAGSLSMAVKDLIVKKVSQMSQAVDNGVDKNSRARYSGHPSQKENPDPA